MNKKLLIVGGIGLLGATAATYLFYHLISGALTAGDPLEPVEMALVVATRDLPRGTELSISDLRLEEWKGGQMPPGAVQDPKALVGKRVKKAVRFREPVLQAGIVGQDDSWLAARIPAGMRGVTVHVSEFVGITEHLEVGDRVDVLVADGPLSPGNPSMRLRTILQNIEILTTGRQTPENRSPAVTLLVSAQDSEKLNLADQSGSIRLSLRNPLDESTEATNGARLSDLMASRDQTSSNRTGTSASRQPAQGPAASGPEAAPRSGRPSAAGLGTAPANPPAPASAALSAAAGQGE